MMHHTTQQPRSDVLVAPDPLDLLSVGFVRDKHLRVPNNGDVEDSYIERLIRSTYGAAERETRRALLPQTRQLVLACFPGQHHYFYYGGFRHRTGIIIPCPPLISVTAIDYIDTDGAAASLDPDDDIYVSIPKGPQARRGFIIPKPVTANWPATQIGYPEAVKITYEAGYGLDGSPAPVGSPVDESALPESAVPQEIVSGMLLMSGEMYKQRSESVDTAKLTPALIRAKDIWVSYRAY